MSKVLVTGGAGSMGRLVTEKLISKGFIVKIFDLPSANYDGFVKSKTEIGSESSIGSNSVLVAPVKIGEGATIGAGSSISKDAEPGQLTVERTRQKTVQGWNRPVKKK